MTHDHSSPLTRLSLEQLGERKSRKWRTYPPDVLPLWIAEIDVLLADPIADAIHTAIEVGDTGYTAGTEFAEAVRDFAAERSAWTTIDPDATSQVPDVMRGMVEGHTRRFLRPQRQSRPRPRRTLRRNRPRICPAGLRNLTPHPRGRAAQDADRNSTGLRAGSERGTVTDPAPTS